MEEETQGALTSPLDCSLLIGPGVAITFSSGSLMVPTGFTRSNPVLTQVALAKLNGSQSKTKNHKTRKRTDMYGIGG